MTYVIVANPETQYSVWPHEKELPAGWYPIDFSGSRTECLDRIAEIWTDIRPRPSDGGSRDE